VSTKGLRLYQTMKINKDSVEKDQLWMKAII